MPDTDALVQLVFFVLIVAGWVIKAIVESKQARQRKSAPRPPRAETGPEGGPQPVHVPRPPLPPPPVPVRGPLSTFREGADRLGRLQVDLADRSDGAAGDAYVPDRLLRSSAAAVAHGRTARRAQRASVLTRLSGGLDVAPGRALTRAGVLWGEILGPCRALTGPHRSPAATRRRRA